MWLLLLIVITVLFFVLVIGILPKICFKYESKEPIMTGKGKKIFEKEEGLTIVYESNSGIAKYIPEYALSCVNGTKIFACHYNSDVYLAKFHLVIFNEKNEIIKILDVVDYVQNKGVSNEIILPDETKYVGILLKKINNNTFYVDNKINAKKSGIALYAFLEMISFAVLIYVSKVCLSYQFAGIYKYTFIENALDEGYIITFIILLLINALVLFLSMAFKNVLSTGGKK